MDAFIGDFCQCDHSTQNLMVSNINIIYKNFYSRPYRIETMEFVWLRVVKATIVAYAFSVRKMLKPLPYGWKI